MSNYSEIERISDFIIDAIRRGDEETASNLLSVMRTVLRSKGRDDDEIRAWERFLQVMGGQSPLSEFYFHLLAQAPTNGTVH